MTRRRDHSVRVERQHTQALKLYRTGARCLCSVVGLALLLAMPRPTQAVAGTCGGAERNCVTEWNKIAEETITVSLPLPRPFQNEGLIYMAYVSAAIYDAAVAIEGRYEPYRLGVTAPAGASADAAVVEAAYQTLIAYFPNQASRLATLHAASLAAIPDGQAKIDGQAVGLAAANLIISSRTGDGRLTPIATTSPFPKNAEAPGVWRLTPPFAAAQTPWVGSVTPFVLQSADQFRPDGPPSLQSAEWVEAFNEIKQYGGTTSDARKPEQTATALFWTANVIRQYNRALRDVVDAYGLNLVDSARLQAMVNIVAADAQIAVMNAKYHFLFWRPVTAIDPEAVTADSYGPVPGYDDGNPATTEQAGWRPLGAAGNTPNHPEYPAAHGSITSAMAEVFSSFLDTNRFNLVVRGFNPATGNMDAVRTFVTPAALRNEIVDARVWAGFHYRFSAVAGVVLGRQVAKYDLRFAFRPIN
jgi:VCPO second helical-bundle domain